MPDIFFIHFFNLTSCAAFETIDYTCQSQLFSHFPAPPLFLCGRFLHLSHWKLSGPPRPPALDVGISSGFTGSRHLFTATPGSIAHHHGYSPRPQASHFLFEVSYLPSRFLFPSASGTFPYGCAPDDRDAFLLERQLISKCPNIIPFLGHALMRAPLTAPPPSPQSDETAITATSPFWHLRSQVSVF